MLKRVAGSVLWLLSEASGVGLGRFAPAVLGWKLGSRPVRQPSEDVRNQNTPAPPVGEPWRLHISRDARHLLTGEEPLAPLGTSVIPYEQRPTLLARFTRVAFVGDAQGRVTMMTAEAVDAMGDFLRDDYVVVPHTARAVMLQARSPKERSFLLQRFHFPEEPGQPDFKKPDWRPARYVEVWCGYDPLERQWYVRGEAPVHSNPAGTLFGALTGLHRYLLTHGGARTPYYTDPLFWLFVLFFGGLLVRFIASLVGALN